MTIKELMIGDWVYNKHFNGEIEPIQIHNIYGTEVNCKTARNRFDVDEIVSGTYMSDLQPIPLTPEILGKNGFTVFLDFKDLVYYESDDKRIKATNSEGMKNTFNEWFIHVDTKDMRTMAYGEVTYVHEFQHLLRLCGIDKEIEL